MTSSNILDAILYHTFHFIYLGHPSDILARIWLAHDIANGDTDFGKSLGENRPRHAWGLFDTSMRESYKTIGTIAGLLAGAMSGLYNIDKYRDVIVIQTLLLAGLTSSVISASSCLSMLSTVYLDPVNIEHHWRSSGIMYIIALAGPSAWLSIALWMFQAAILAIVWMKESTPAKIIVTGFIGLRILLKVAGRLHATTPVTSCLLDFILGLLGMRQGVNYSMVKLNPHTIKRRDEYLRTIGNAIRNSQTPSPIKSEDGAVAGDRQIPKSVFMDIERANFFRGLESPEDD